jgi:predicted transposase YbfD/YdcC
LAKTLWLFRRRYSKADIITRVICRLKSDEIEHAFQSWISSLIETTGADIIAIDGKTARRSFTTKDRKSALHTVSAWSCQQAIAKQIMKQKADCIFALKGNHSGMQSELEAWWHKSEREGLSDNNHDEHSDISSGHGRIETRKCQQLLINKSWLAKDYQWPGLKSIIKVTAQVHDESTGKE